MKHHIYNTEFFLDENERSFYLLGLFITDGNVYFKKSGGGEACLKIIDKDFLFDLCAEIVPTKLPTKVKDSNCYRLRLNNKSIIDWLVKYGCVPNKTKIVKFPLIMEKYLPDLIRGLIDGDGSIGFYKNQAMIRFDSASFDLINQLQKTLESWGLNSKIKKTPWIESIIKDKVLKTTTQMYRISFHGLKAYKLLKICYKPDSLCLDRKKKVVEEIFSHYESKGFSKEELLSLDRLPIKKWISDYELVELVLKHKGSLKNSAKEIGVSAWGLSSKLRKIDKYNYIRSIYPIDNIKNITG